MRQRYSKVPAYKDSIRVVNIHDGYATKSFYCDLLNAEKACKLETDRVNNTMAGKAPSIVTVPKHVELAMGLNWNRGITSKKQILDLGTKYVEKMDGIGLSETDLPQECLSPAETSMLLKVSLEYEEILLPDDGDDGLISTNKTDLQHHFATLLENGVFCSVDTDRIVDSPKWQFLFDQNEI